MCDYYNSPYDDFDYDGHTECSKCAEIENDLFEAGDFLQGVWDELSKSENIDISIFCMLDEAACRIGWNFNAKKQITQEIAL